MEMKTRIPREIQERFVLLDVFIKSVDRNRGASGTRLLLFHFRLVRMLKLPICLIYRTFVSLCCQIEFAYQCLDWAAGR